MAVAVVLLLTPMAALAQSDAEREREEVDERRSELSSEVDVLRASNGEIEAALDDIDSAIAARRAAADAADAAANDAEAVHARSEAKLEAARADVEMLRQAVQEMAIASYIHPPTEDFVQSLTVADFSDSIIARTYLDARAKRDSNLLNLLRAAEATAETRAAESQRAATAAREAAETADAEVAALESERARQQDFAAEVQVRIDGALAESAALADIDAELAAQIAEEQAALIERIPPPQEPDTVALSAAAPTPATAPTTTAPSPSAADVPATTVPPTTSPPTTAPSPPPPPSSTPPLRTVYGITVHADIAGNVARLVEAAQAAGISLGGGGYRSPDAQIATRRANCGTSTYAIYYMPSSQCSPPTAPPGTSMHERGLAIDFTAGGQLIRSRDSDAFRWLADNAGSHGLRNLPVEPWHWSTTGN